MRGITLIFVLCVAQVASHEIVNLPPFDTTSPSFLEDLRVELVPDGERYKLNISWAINIDASIGYLTATMIEVFGSTLHCQYNPPLVQANLTSLKQKWFYYLVSASYGHNIIQVANLPLPAVGNGRSYKVATITVPCTIQHTATEETDHVNANFQVLAIFKCLASLMILASCYIICKNFRANFARWLGFSSMPTSSTDHVPVLVVYPAKNSAFQQGVMALAEFLQWHGSCSVAVDMWQQGKIAELGPMRWLAEQAQAAERVLIVCPQVEIVSAQPSSASEASIPVAAHDLYPLILNLVASHAKSAGDLAKFWVVQLGEQQAKMPSRLPPELRACKTFCLMKDLTELCSSLHTQRQGGKKTSAPVFRPGTEKTAVKLREAVENLGRWQPGPFSKVEKCKVVITSI
uniref:SEFIR domain-containing protein n=1 Tax=Mola mola TaxID=94237 RepID=A0A3Q3VIV9_MOLML